MKVSLNFLKEFLDVKISPAKLADLLTMAGMEVESLKEISGDWIFDIEVTTNRYDWLSVLGIAFEAAAITGKKVKVNSPATRKEPAYKQRNIIIENSKDCPYYVARVINNIKVGISNQRLKEKITNCGISSVNNAVDITNYVMLKWGNPLHAFDLDKIEGDIYIRRARRGESFIGIDSRQRKLDKNNLVVADSKKIIALAGVIGSKDSEVDGNTRNILLEAAIFSAPLVRLSRRLAGVETESSYRFERRVPPQYLDQASHEAASLIEKACQGSIEGLKTAGKKPRSAVKKIILSFAKLKDYLGVSIPKADVKRILKALRFDLKDMAKDKIQLTVPCGRFDLKTEVDVYEEICRIYGYDKIPAVIPHFSRLDPKLFSRPRRSYEFKNEVADHLALIGFKEIVTYSLASLESCEKLAKGKAIKLINPLRSQENAMRPSLILGMVQSIKHNLNRNQSDLSFFEIASIYQRTNKGFIEEPVLAIAVTAKAQVAFKLKGAIENLMDHLGIAFKSKPADLSNFSSGLQLFVKNSLIGTIGRLDDSLAEEFNLKESLFFAQINLSELLKNSRKKSYRPFSSYPAVFRDISICLRRDIKFQILEEIIKKAGRYLADLEVIDIYKEKDLPQDSKIFTLRLFYQSQERTLTSGEVDSAHTAIRNELSQQQGVTLR